MSPPQSAVDEALGHWSAAEVEVRITEGWAPRLADRFRKVVRTVVRAQPELARGSGLLGSARRVLAGGPELWAGLAADPAWGRLTTALEEVGVEGSLANKRLAPLCSLAPRMAVASCLLQGGDMETRVVLGPGGRARVPTHGGLLQGAAGRPLRVVIEAGELRTHTRDPRRVGPFEVVDGDAEGGRIPAVQPLSGGDVFEAARRLEAGVAILAATAPAILEEAAALSPVLVAVRSAEDVSHSCTVPGARAAIWMSAPARPLVVAETLVHEASHLKLLFAEDRFAYVTEADGPVHEVPWRPDRRPSRAVLLGLHAWTRVVMWLRTLEGTEWRQPAAERRVLLETALAAARDVLDREGHLTGAGRALTEALWQAGGV